MLTYAQRAAERTAYNAFLARFLGALLALTLAGAKLLPTPPAADATTVSRR